MNTSSLAKFTIFIGKKYWIIVKIARNGTELISIEKSEVKNFILNVGAR